jgi:hypothetical protein
MDGYGSFGNDRMRSVLKKDSPMGRFLLMIPVMTAAIFAIASAQASAECNEPHPIGKEEFKQIPILERYYRPGHLYGNTVRRRYARGVSRLYDEFGNPTSRLSARIEEKK